MNPSIDELTEHYLRGELTDAEVVALEERLSANDAERSQFRRAMRLEANLRAHATEQQSEVTVWSGVRTQEEATLAESLRALLWRWWTPLATALVVIGTVAWLMWPHTYETGFILASADAAVKVERAGVAMMLPVGTMLREGDVIITGGAGIVASYPVEETRLELDPHTRLEVLTHRDGKRLRLLAGSLSAEVSPQPEGRPMRLFSPGAEAVVLGTRFTLSADAPRSELAVHKGAVRVNRTATEDSIVVSAAEKVMLGAKSLELESLPPLVPPRWRDEHTLALDFETPVTWPVLRGGRVVANPQEPGSCLTGELVEVVRRKGDKLVLATSLRPQCVLSAASQLKLRYWAASGIESIEVFLYVVGVERAFKAELKPEAHDRWMEWTLSFVSLKSATGAPPSSDATLRSISIHTSPVSGPLAFYVDDVVLEHVSPLPLSR